MLIQKVIAVIMMIYQGFMAFAQMMASSYFVMALHLFIAFFIYEKLYRPTKAYKACIGTFIVTTMLGCEPAPLNKPDVLIGLGYEVWISKDQKAYVQGKVPCGEAEEHAPHNCSKIENDTVVVQLISDGHSWEEKWKLNGLTFIRPNGYLIPNE